MRYNNKKYRGGIGTRSILKKINRQAPLDSDEYRRLLEYYEDLRRSSPESYALFYDDYADVLFHEYGIWLPRFAVDFDDLVNLLLNQPELAASLSQDTRSLDQLPQEYRPFVSQMLGQTEARRRLLQLLQSTETDPQAGTLPPPRQQEAVYIYEDGNPYKEIGLKTHFERLGRFNFITRLQSYRYLSRHKASQDRIQYLSPDCLAGIFSNKEKSIYYYIFLSEDSQLKAKNAARLLNLTLYGNSGGA